MDGFAAYDAFFAGRQTEWEISEALRAALLMRWPQILPRVMKTCISFDDPKPVCYISFPRKKNMTGLILTISLSEKMDHPRFQMVVPVSKHRYTVHILLEDAASADTELIDLIAFSRR